MRDDMLLLRGAHVRPCLSSDKAWYVEVCVTFDRSSQDTVDIWVPKSASFWDRSSDTFYMSQEMVEKKENEISLFMRGGLVGIDMVEGPEEEDHG